MAPDRETFSIYGPKYLTHVDWNNPHHRRIVAASLVRAAYILVNDRRKNRSKAPEWWEFFNFQLVDAPTDKHDGSPFAAVFQYMNFQHHTAGSGRRPPRYVIAFRGTMKTPGNLLQDLKLDFNIFFNTLKFRSRSVKGFETARDLVECAGPGDVWLAGHSLGSSLALVAGQELVKEKGFHLETYLFSPPFPSAAIGLLPDNLELVVRMLHSFVTAGLAARLRSDRDDRFSVLSAWTPYLFVNVWDQICSEYVGYFRHREQMESMGAGKFGNLATQHSMFSILGAHARVEGFEAVHLIPTAYLVINRISASLREAHGIEQWWSRDLQFDYTFYQHTHR